MLDQDEDSGEFRFLLLGPDGRPAGLVTRSRAGSPPSPAVFTGVQHRWDSTDWMHHIDTTSEDHLWSARIVKAVKRL